TAFRAAGITAQLGNTTEAKQLYEQAKTQWTSLLDKPSAQSEAHPDDEKRTVLSNLAKCENNRAELFFQEGEYDPARNAYQAAISLQEQLISLDPQRHDDSTTLAETLSNLGLLEAQDGHPKRAEDYLKRSILLLEQIQQEDPTARRLHDLAIARNNLSYVLRDHRPSRSLVACRQARDILERLVMENPDELEFQSDFAQCYSNEATLLTTENDLTAAREAYGKAINLLRRLVRQAGNLPAYRRDLAVTLSKVAQLEGSQLSNDLTAANRHYSEAIEVAASLAADFPQATAFGSLHAGVLNNQAMLLESTNQLRQAVDTFAAAVAFQSEAFEKMPTHAAREQLSRQLFNYGRSLRKTGEPEQAAEIALQRKKLWPEHGEHLYHVAVELAESAKQITITK
ncbi:MAG: tetratricopeptide repeat protein, partial [Lacipirellulaceae bacterium]